MPNDLFLRTFCLDMGLNYILIIINPDVINSLNSTIYKFFLIDK